MAKAKRKKARSPAQKAAFAKARAALKAKYGTTNIGKIRGRKKGRKRSTRREEEEEMLLENAAKKKTRKKRKAKKAKKAKTTKRKTKRTAPKKRRKAKAKAPAAAAPKKRRKKARKAAAPKARKKARRKSRKSSKRTKHTVAGKIHVVKLPGRTIVKEIRVEAAKKRSKKRKKKSNYSGRAWPGAVPSRELALLENPTGEGLGGYGALFENPMGPYSTSSLKGFGWAAGGVGLGLVVAELVDRYVATRTPSDSKGGAKGNNPWFGRDAAAAMQRRPDALRLGVQAVGALAGIGGAYALRGRSIAPWLIGGTAVGFGANLFKQLVMWWVAPRLLKSKPNEALLGNRLLPLEQVELQDSIDTVWEDWQQIASLASAQAVAGTPVAVSPLNAPGSADLLTLGGATGNGPLPGAVGFVAQPGRVGACMSCGGMGGCWSNCPQACGTKCPEGSGIPRDGGGGDGGQRGRLCEYVVQAGDNLSALLDESGVSANDIAMLNGGGTPDSWWKAGATVVLPEQACYVVWRHQNGGGGDDGGGGQPLIPQQPPGGGQPFIPQQPGQPERPPAGGGGDQVFRSFQPQVPARPQQVFRSFQPQVPAIPQVRGVGEVADEVQRQTALRNVGGDESDEE